MNIKKLKILALFGILLVFCALSPVAAEERMLIPSWDSHLHYLDFTQKTDGFPALVKQMDAIGIEAAVIFGMPIVKMWSESDPIRPDYYLDTDARAYYYSATDFILAQELLQQPEKVRKRFYPFISGINPLDRNAAEYIETVLRLYPGFWRGIGELMSRHDDLTAFAYGEPPRADHPALMEVYRIAAKHGLPVLIHHNISSAWKREPIYLHEMERALAANPGTIFIWAHAGISRRVEVPSLRKELVRILETYPNLNIDLSWVVYDTIVKDTESFTGWIALIERFPDRFLLGSDTVGHWTNYPNELTKYNVLLNKLTPETAKKFACDNIRRLLRIDK
ncbi:MAG: Amidohydrolase [Syntrophorhabdus sp. PtaU1.Bin058]|nr:MAG: Amidohydrolase [Syntrophorhabdus sp. PtaU1.Bin058]